MGGGTTVKMPTKTRYVLRTHGGYVYTGKMAVALLCKEMSKLAMSADMPANWKELSSRRKLAFLALRMPKNNTLLIFQEPRWCRKNKSLYIKAIQNRGKIARDLPPHVGEAPLGLEEARRLYDPPRVAGLRPPAPRNRPNNQALPPIQRQAILPNEDW